MTELFANPIIWLLLGLLLGLILGLLSAWLFLAKQQGARQDELSRLLADQQASERSVVAELGEARESLASIRAARTVELQAAEEKVRLLEDARTRLETSFKALSAEALSRNNTDFLNLARTTLETYQKGAKTDLDRRQESIAQTVGPVAEALKTFNERVDRIEDRRTRTDSSLREQLTQLTQSQLQLSKTTGSLVQALRAPQVRGQWGEMQLRRTVEMAGMVNRVDFIEQASLEDQDGQRQRPDMLIQLPNYREVVVDAKVPLDAYLSALQTEDPERQVSFMRSHARQVREHIRGLSSKAYWSQFESAPEFVVLFIPNETIFSAALEQEPKLIEHGVESQVILATPTTLIALLKAIAYGWQQDAIAKEAKEISALGKELYDRVQVVTEHFGRVGKSLEQAVKHYNSTVGSFESRMLVTARKFDALESSTDHEIDSLSPIERVPTLPKSER